ncbi:siderophore-iron reductase FhuF [Salinisphaera sp. Q1T1-3]|uniref:siderophore-iron reductase FhuF n=1 Tax=Salinisphaera sp. Q1T1-3 TaxID=2321229 RepID=UPI000E72EA21|nr:siderophore-iron reductase FhuF [Salinisphaera sp. Q1T1-3]RJS93477.1 siderophore-iron reductase FhuF [Salinisphaera sp. Q1T1-3]
MHPECFHDNLSFARTLFVIQPDEPAGASPSAALADATAITPMLSCYSRSCGACEPRAVASQWSKFVFARLVIPSLVLQCCLDRAIDFRTAPWAFTRGEDGTPAGFVFAADPLGPVGTGHDYSSLIDDAISPVIGALCAGAGLARRVYASNASMYFAWALEQLEGQRRGQRHALAAARDLVESAARPDGGFNPFHAPFKTLPQGCCDGNGEPASECRRLCCVRDLDACWGLCSNCPRAVKREPACALADQA